MKYYKLVMVCLILSVVDISNSQGASYNSGYATRYWDCCKPHCAWTEHVSGDPIRTCNFSNESNNDFDIKSSCDGGDGYTCYNMAPWAVTSELSYGFAAVPATNDICGKCYELKFTGTGHSGDDPGAQRLLGKRMIVQAINIGYDVEGGQFDILIPGGGVGQFNACSDQWGVPDSALGDQYGGFLSACKNSLEHNGSLEEYKKCILEYCEEVFSQSGMSDLKEGCHWFVEWYEAADNPNIEYKEVQCPQAIVNKSGIGTAINTIILTDTSPDAVIDAGSIVKLYGTNEINNLTIGSGAEVELFHFPGNNIVTLESTLNVFSVFRSGATIVLNGSDGTILKIPATMTPQLIVFDDTERTLIIESERVILGEQVITMIPAAVE